MKKKLFLLIAVCMAIGPTAIAYDFSVEVPSGQTLFFNRLSSNTVEVTAENPTTSQRYSTNPTENLVIPEIVIYNDITHSVIAIGEHAFYGCSGLTSVTIPSSITTIGRAAFGQCTGLTSVVVPNSVTTIGIAAFSGCKGISVFIPSSVTSIGDGAFSEVKHIEYHGTATGAPWNAYYMNGVTDGEFVYTDESKTILLAYVGTASDATIPATVIKIGNRAFYNFKNLTSVTIPNSVTIIGTASFCGCEHLMHITIPTDVNQIGNIAFYKVRHIEYHGTATYTTSDKYWGAHMMNGVIDGDFVYTSEERDTLIQYIGNQNSITIPSSVTSVKDAFVNNTFITSVIIPESVTFIEEGAFSGCQSLTNIVVSEGNTIYDSRNNCNAIIETSSNTLVQGCKNTIIPNSVTSIGDGAFASCNGLTSINIPNSVTSIGDGAFASCNGLTSINIPNSVTFMGDGVFARCKGLTSINISNGVNRIGSSAFQGCTRLTSVIIPECVTSIGDNAFHDCRGMTDVSIPASVISIDIWAFADCFKLTSITIPANVTSIGSFAFLNTDNLQEINILALIPPMLGDGGVFSVNNDIPIYIPCGTQSYYQSQWQCFSNFQERFEYSVNVTESEHGHVNIVQPTCMNPTATLTAIPNEGFRFSHWSDGSTDNPYNINITSNKTISANYSLLPSCPGEWCEVSIYATDGYGDGWNGNTIHVMQNGIEYDSYTMATQNLSNTIIYDTATIRVCLGTPINFIWETGLYADETSFKIINSEGVQTYAIDAGNVLTNNEIFLSMESCDGSRVIYDTVFDTVYNNYSWYDSTYTESGIYTVDTMENGLHYFHTLVLTLTFQVTVLSSDDNLGIVLGEGIYNQGETIALTAIPNVGIQFNGWSNQCATNPQKLTVMGDTTITAYFSVEFDTVINNYYQYDTTIVNIYDTVIQYDTTIINIYQYDTTIVNNFAYDTSVYNHFLYDTTLVFDTTIINIYTYDTSVYYNYRYDTVIINHYMYDTTLVYDTTIINTYQYDTTIVNVFDTVIRNIYQYDTTIFNNYIFDTSIYRHFQYDTTLVFDTTIINIYTYDTSIYNNYQFDTVVMNYYQYDTTLVNVYDTTIINIYDTTIHNLYQYDTVIVNHYYYDTTIVNNYDTVNNYYHDTVIITHTYHDTMIVNNYVYDTIYLNRYIFDTVYIHDTVFVNSEGIDGIETVDAKIYQRDGRIVVESGDGEALGEVRVFDVMGRCVAVGDAADRVSTDGTKRYTFEVPMTGTYLVKIGNHPARKIVVIR